jgi:hypothetical protein
MEELKATLHAEDDVERDGGRGRALCEYVAVYLRRGAVECKMRWEQKHAALHGKDCIALAGGTPKNTVNGTELPHHYKQISTHPFQ